MHLLEFHATNPFTFWSPAFVHNLYIFSLITLVTLLFILSAWFIIRYLRGFYRERPIPKEWKVFWWAFVFFAIHDVQEVVFLYQWIHGQIFNFLFFGIEIASIVLLTWGCYLLVKTYVLKR